MVKLALAVHGVGAKAIAIPIPGKAPAADRTLVTMFRIREATDNDFGQLTELYNSARAFAGCFSGKAVDIIGMKMLTDGEVVYVSERGHQIGGFISVWTADSFIHHLYVLPELHGQGIGSTLLAFCCDRYGPLSLKCEIANVGAQQFYRKRGWAVKNRGEGVDGAWERFHSP